MSITPLFVRDMATLRARLSLSGATQTDTVQAIESATIVVRAKMYARLGAARVDAIEAIEPAVDATSPLDPQPEISPQTADQRLRSIAEEAEVLWIKWILLHDLPTLFMDSSFKQDQVWNEEGLTRRATTQIDDMLDRTRSRLQDLLGFLDTNGTKFGGKVTAVSIGPDTTPVMRPGDSVRQEARYGL